MIFQTLPAHNPCRMIGRAWWLIFFASYFLGIVQTKAQNCANDTIRPIAACSEIVFVSLAPDGRLTVGADIFNEGSYDNTNIASLAVAHQQPACGESSNFGPAITFCCEQVGDTNLVVLLRVTDCNNNTSVCFSSVKVEDKINIGCESVGFITGRLATDLSGNCTVEAGEPSLAGWPVIVRSLPSGRKYRTVTDSMGSYFIAVYNYADTLMEIQAETPLTAYCPPTILVVGQGDTVHYDLPFVLEPSCRLLSIDASTVLLRRCFDNWYQVQVTNLSAGTVNDVLATVQLDPFFRFKGSSIPYLDSLPDNVWRFPIGTLGPGEVRRFSIQFALSCDAQLSQTHCVRAFVTPQDTTCGVSRPNWSGAALSASAQCKNGNVELTLRNTGKGNMTQDEEFVVVEDVIMFQKGKVRLDAGESRVFSLPANGATWAIQAKQVTQHPWGGMVAAAVEGCGGFNSVGQVKNFPLNNPNPFEVVDCEQNRGSFDPNEKQAFPAGMTDRNFIEPNTNIEYKIGFQNTGTDTAFTVVLRDTLSDYLDPRSVRPGASSHPYSFTIQGNVLRFEFSPIALPDSHVNERASHGYVKFSIAQKRDLAYGTRIENKAAIYFDRNDPVITNTVFHELGRVISTAAPFVVSQNLTTRVSPLPASGSVNFDWSIPVYGQLLLFSSDGSMVRGEQVNSNRHRLERGKLPAGIYFYQLTGKEGILARGKLIFE